MVYAVIRAVLSCLALMLALQSGALAQAVGNGQSFNAAGNGAGQSALGPYVLPTPAAGSTDFFDGDSITFGTGASSCSGTSASPSGTCWADLVAIHDGAHEINKGVSGTCLEFTSTSGSTCNQSSTTTGSLINRYLNDFTSLTAGMRYYQMIGTNDVYGYSHPDPLVTYATFRANLVTVLNAAAAKVGASNIVVVEIPYSNPAGFFTPTIQALLNSAAADVATQYGYALAAVSSTQTACKIANPSDTTLCMAVDGIHPDTAGHAAIALQVEAANYASAVSASDSNRKAYSLSDLTFGIDPLVSTNAFFPWGSAASNTAAGQTFLGVSAGSANSTAPGQTFVGFQSGFHASTGVGQNTAVGYQSCYQLTSGSQNTCLGYGSGLANVTTSNNTSVGFGALNASTVANQTAVGSTACFNITTGAGNTCIGQAAGQFFGVAFGSNLTSSQSVYLGNLTAAAASGDAQEIVIGANMLGRGSNSIAIGGGTAPGFYSGTGVPSFSATNGSMYSNYSLANPTPYINTSGASSSGTTWTRLVAPTFVSCTDSSVGVISCSATVAYTSATSYACGMSYVGPTTTTGAATGITVVNTSNTSVTGTVVGLAVATGTATILFNCTGT